MSFSTASPQDRAARRVGTVLAGKYGIERLLGAGGMASVYAGVHRNGRRVAIKLLHEELGAIPDVRARFVREGYVANAVGHPGAVHVYDDDVAEDGAVFLVMELLEGETLADRVRRRGGALPCREVLALAHQLLDVLAASHARGVVHRDIKPENLFLTTDLELKVLDFGVARMRDDTSACVTATGIRIGTPAFMPPEQALGRTAEIDARTDLWAAGATMFALLAGRTVHAAQNAAEMVVITATTPARTLAEHAPDVPAEVVVAVDRALAFARDDRWPDARAMQRALEEAHLAAFGEPLDPAAVGPLPEPRVVVPRTEDERGTLPLRPAAHGTTLPTPPGAGFPTRASGPGLPISGPVRPLSSLEAESGRTRGETTVSARGQIGHGQSTSPSGSEDDVAAPPVHRAGAPVSGPPISGPPVSAGSTDVRSSTPTPPPAAHGAPRSSTPTPPPPDGDAGAPVSTPAPPPAVASDASPATVARRWPLIVGAVAIAAAGFVLARWTAPPPALGPPPVGAQPVIHGSGGGDPAAAARACSTNVDCRGDVPAICRKDDGVCVALETTKCKVLASPGDVENDATVWIGAMFPIGLPDPTRDGPRSGNAIDLARRDFATMTGGLLPAKPGGPKRPIGVVLCDDLESAEPAARHLVEDLRVPAVIGFALSKEVMELSTSLFNPRGVLALAANTASMLRDIPRSPSGERLVWRVTTSADMNVPVLAALVSEVVEPALRAQPGLLTPGEPIRVAFVRIANPTGQSYADTVAATLRFNGRSVAENGENFQQLLSSAYLETDAEDDRRVASQLVDLAPHVILHSGGNDLVAAVEKDWRSSLRYRPWHLRPSGFLPTGMAEWAREHPELRRRYLSIDAAVSRDIVSRYVLRYNELFSPQITVESAVMAPYDAFYVLAYAAAALGSEPITGPALARAIPRLLRGAPTDVGPGNIYQAFYTLAEGKDIDLRGGMTTLDFDPRTGDAAVDRAILCLTPPSGDSSPRMVESGLFFRSTTGRLDGALRCP